MIEWTSAAKQALENHITRLRPSLASTGADAGEVAEDLKRHMETEAAAEQLKIITDEDARRILARMGPLPEARPMPEPAATPRGAPEPGLRRGGGVRWSGWPRTGLTILFGVLLPLGTLCAELVTHMCAGTFFDPIPTWWHVALVALVPLANLAAVILLGRPSPSARAHSWIWILNGVAVGVATVYTFLYLPLMPLSALAVIFFGMGFLSLAPVFALMLAIRLRYRLRNTLGKRESFRSLPWWGGFAAAVVALALLAIPAPLTRHWERMAVAEDPETSLKGVQQLRRFGHRETLLGDCYGTTSWKRDNPWRFDFAGSPATPEQCRELRWPSSSVGTRCS